MPQVRSVKDLQNRVLYSAEGKAVPSGWVRCLLLVEYFFIMEFFLDLFGFLVVITIVDIFREPCIVKVLSLQLFGMAC